jgi:hypothetical protein
LDCYDSCGISYFVVLEEILMFRSEQKLEGFCRLFYPLPSVRRKNLLLIGVFLLLLIPFVSAGYSEKIYVDDDTYVNNESGTTNYDDQDDTDIFLDEVGGSQSMRYSMWNWDDIILNSSSERVVHSVDFHIFEKTYTSEGSISFVFDYCPINFDEASVTWNNVNGFSGCNAETSSTYSCTNEGLGTCSGSQGGSANFYDVTDFYDAYSGSGAFTIIGRSTAHSNAYGGHTWYNREEGGASGPYLLFTYSFAPEFTEISDQSLYLDDLGSTIEVDLHSYISDDFTDDSSLTFTLVEENTNIINCMIVDEQYFRCNDPLLVGSSIQTIKGYDAENLYGSISFTVNVIEIQAEEGASSSFDLAVTKVLEPICPPLFEGLKDTWSWFLEDWTSIERSSKLIEDFFNFAICNTAQMFNEFSGGKL